MKSKIPSKGELAYGHIKNIVCPYKMSNQNSEALSTAIAQSPYLRNDIFFV